MNKYYTQAFSVSQKEYKPDWEDETRVVAHLGADFAPGIWVCTEGVVIDTEYGKMVIEYVDLEGRSLWLRLY